MRIRLFTFGGETMAISIVPMTAAHIRVLAEIEQACFSTPWSEAALAEELSNQTAHFFVAEREDGTPVGYVGLQVVGDEGFFTNVAVHPDARRQGVADALLKTLTAFGAAHKLYRLTLEVRVSNAAAVALYEKHGYVRDGIRPAFYRAPAEDAAVYSLYY